MFLILHRTTVPRYCSVGSRRRQCIPSGTAESQGLFRQIVDHHAHKLDPNSSARENKRGLANRVPFLHVRCSRHIEPTTQSNESINAFAWFNGPQGSSVNSSGRESGRIHNVTAHLGPPPRLQKRSARWRHAFGLLSRNETTGHSTKSSVHWRHLMVLYRAHRHWTCSV
jgi:hypothetical protein